MLYNQQVNPLPRSVAPPPGRAETESSPLAQAWPSRRNSTPLQLVSHSSTLQSHPGTPAHNLSLTSPGPSGPSPCLLSSALKILQVLCAHERLEDPKSGESPHCSLGTPAPQFSPFQDPSHFPSNPLLRHLTFTPFPFKAESLFVSQISLPHPAPVPPRHLQPPPPLLPPSSRLASSPRPAASPRTPAASAAQGAPSQSAPRTPAERAGHRNRQRSVRDREAVCCYSTRVRRGTIPCIPR